MAIIRAITELASSLGMTTIAEGIETWEQLRELMTVGCCEAQGYWWSRPLPAREARALCERQTTPLPTAITAGQAAA
jgi:EAL domain-containing protein (putative c-di-GMP-specific phosphodiesterase class I)